MSARELDRLEVLDRVIERRLTQRQSAERLGLSLGQLERLCQALRSDAAGGLVSRKRGRPSNRKLPEAVREHALDLGSEPGTPTSDRRSRVRSCTEEHGVAVCVETLRQ